MPLQLARVRVKRNDGTGVEIVAGAIVAIPVGPRVSNSPVRQVEVGIVRSCDPDGSTTVLPGIAVGRPGFVARFAGAGDRIEAPRFFSGLCIIGRDEATDTKFTAGRAD